MTSHAPAARSLPDLVLRTARLDDAAEIAAFAEQVFRDTFGPHNRAEDMDAHCRATFAIAQIERELSDPDRQTVLATVGDAIAGYLHLRAGAPPACVTGPDPYELKRLYVSRPWHGTGVADALMTRAVDLARQRGTRTFYLSVWQHNHRAIAFYARHGFAIIGTAPFQLGADIQYDPIMARDLPGRT
jgi:ribosomal protein S18 acetylase RimI-like enzyme